MEIMNKQEYKKPELSELSSFLTNSAKGSAVKENGAVGAPGSMGPS